MLGKSGSTPGLSRNSSFLQLFAASGISISGLVIVYKTVNWIAYTRTGSAVLLAVIGIAALSPAIFIQPFTHGTIINRYERRVLISLAAMREYPHCYTADHLVLSIWFRAARPRIDDSGTRGFRDPDPSGGDGVPFRILSNAPHWPGLTGLSKRSRRSLRRLAPLLEVSNSRG